MNPICSALNKRDLQEIFSALRYCYGRYTFCMAEMKRIINKILRNEGIGRIKEADTPDKLVSELENNIRKRLEREETGLSTAVIEESIRNFLERILLMGLTIFADKVGIKCLEATGK